MYKNPHPQSMLLPVTSRVHNSKKMPFNRIAVYGHRGWVSSAIVAALIESGVPLKVLHRPGSDVSNLPDTVATFEVDLEDQEKLVDALQGVDIVMYVVLPFFLYPPDRVFGIKNAVTN